MFDFWNSITNVSVYNWGASLDTIIYASIGIGVIGYIGFKIYNFIFGGNDK